MKTAKKIGLVGTYDVNNFGDCIFPEVYQQLLRQEFPDADITLYSPTDHAAEILSFDRIKALPKTPADCDMDEDVLILTGGEVITYGHSTGYYVFPKETFSAGLRLWVAPILAAATGKTKTMFHCVGGVPLPEGFAKSAAKVLACADYVSFRDQTSVDRFSTTVDAFDTAVDPMFLIPELLSKEAWIERATALLPDGLGEGEYFVAHLTAAYLVAHGPRDWALQIAKIADATGKRPLLLPICHFLHDDITLARAAQELDAIGVRYSALSDIVNVKDTAAIIAASGGYVGTSLHGAVSSVGFAKPTAVFAKGSGSKHEGTLRRAGVEGVVTTDMNQLGDVFLKAHEMPHEALAVQAAELAQADFKRLIAKFDDPNKAQKPEPSDIALLMAADRDKAKGFKAGLQRGILRLVKVYEPAYFQYKRLRLRSKLAAKSSEAA